jgi:hypothetical protein
MACPTMFYSTHAASNRFTNEEIDAFHDDMVADEGRIFDEVMRGRPEAPRRMSLLPTRSVPTHWLGEAELEDEVFGFAMED